MKVDWNPCAKMHPDSERQVQIVLPDRVEVVAGHWFSDEGIWVLAGTLEQVYPLVWCEMAENPLID